MQLPPFSESRTLDSRPIDDALNFISTSPTPIPRLPSPPSTQWNTYPVIGPPFSLGLNVLRHPVHRGPPFDRGPGRDARRAFLSIVIFVPSAMDRSLVSVTYTTTSCQLALSPVAGRTGHASEPPRHRNAAIRQSTCAGDTR